VSEEIQAKSKEEKELKISKKIEFPYISIIPYNVMSDKNLNPSSKLHFGCLSALAKKVGYCYATDEQLAEMHKVDESQIKRWNKNLEESGYISRETKSISYRNKEGKLLWKKYREIYIGDGFSKKDCDKCKNAPIVDGCKNAPLYNSKSLIENYINVPNPKKGDSKPDIFFSLDDYKFNNISDSDHETWKVLYPTIDIPREILKAEEWLRANLTKAKLKKKWREFLRKWLQKAEDYAFNKKAYSSQKQIKANEPKELNPEYLKIKPMYDRYNSWYNNITAQDLINLGKIMLSENGFYDYKSPTFVHKWNYDKFMNLLKTKYRVPSHAFNALSS